MDGGFVVFRSDGKRLCFLFSLGLKRRLDNTEVNSMTDAQIRAYPGANAKRFYE